MRAQDFIKEHNKVIFWNIHRFNWDTNEWDRIERCEITDYEEVDEAFFNSIYDDDDSCDLYLE